VGTDAPLVDAPSAERRLVSVLFADLVGFTPLSEKRDAEEVRELLTRYFDTCRALVHRYGGVVEKFIGDAVMAVWGAPLSHEDDAERAVRAALDLVEAVTAMGVDIGVPGLRARAGVLTGDAAVTLGNEAQGMVAGDLVNTASRVQAEAEPGTVLVGEATRNATEAALVYEDAGEHALKGKTEPVRLWRALRVVAGRGGALKSQGLEAPFVGRERELRLIKDQFHACAEERRAQLLSVAGIAGIGKSRLSWEFEKYIDGVAETVLWHRGRCLAYGEGVTYWALAEMVRMRAGIAEAEDPVTGREKLQACLAEYLTDSEERRWAEPRLAHLLALEEHTVHEREDLFSAWRLFFERLAEQQPTVLVFEDMQWADSSLLDFIEYLLEWSRSHPLYVVTLSRPELMDKHPTWGAGKRSFTSVFLEPLAAAAMEQLLDGLVPGLPDGLREQILDRAEGVPLYAMETVRMLLDRGLLTRAGSIYRLTGRVEDLEVPQSLHALIAARLDGLRPEARRLLQNAAVLGKTFTLASLAAVSGTPVEEVESMLSDLVRKEVLSLQSDPRSPERGQYGFLQDLVKRVAYETLSKRDRKEKHLAVAAWFESSWGGEEGDVVELVASHYLEAYNLAPQDPDAEQVKERAAAVLSQAGERAASLAAKAEAEHYFQEAARLVGVPSRRAHLLERAGQMAGQGGRPEAAAAHYEEARALYDSEHHSHAAARVTARLGEVDWQTGHLERAVERMEEAFTALSSDPADADLAMLAAELGRLHFFKGEFDPATARTLRALEIAESLSLPDVIAEALNTRGILALNVQRAEEAEALLTHALKMAVDNDLPSSALRAYTNLSEALCRRDRYAEALGLYESCLALARRIGDRFWEGSTLSEMTYVLLQSGRWDEAEQLAAEIPESEMSSASPALSSFLVASIEREINTGNLVGPETLLSMFDRHRTSADVQERCMHAAGRACWFRALGRTEDSLAAAEEALEAIGTLGPGSQAARVGFVEAVEAALQLGDLTKAEQLLTTVDALPLGECPPLLRGQAARLHARLSAARHEVADVDARFAEAEKTFRELAIPFWLAVTLLERAEWLAMSGQTGEAEPLFAEARPIFQRLRAQPWLERLNRPTSAAVAVSGGVGG
jgi:class 3 adenylate cyclase/tetratricopeptide (TPR) repeat protein